MVIPPLRGPAGAAHRSNHAPATRGDREKENLMQYRYIYQRGDVRRATRWYSDEEQAREIMTRKVGHFHPLGRVAGDGNSAPDGSHACPRNGGLMALEVRPG